MNGKQALGVALILSLSACAAGPAAVVKPATAEQKAALIDQVKQLQGSWDMSDEKGKPVASAVFQVTAEGSAVREVLFPAAPHEMTNMYHMDGDTLVMTHYCAGDNQPRMRATPGAPGVLDFKFDSVTNLKSADESYMGEMKLTIQDQDHAQQQWTSFKNGTRTSWVFNMTRAGSAK